MNAKPIELPVGSESSTLAHPAWWGYFMWILLAALIGFIISYVGAGLLHLPRNLFLIPYGLLVTLFFYTFLRWSNLSIANLLRHNWYWGLVGALLAGAFTVRNILSQPASARSEGLTLVFEILWVGIAYGLMDALLLSVIPFLATWKGLSTLGWTTSLPGKIIVGGIAILASLFVTIIYHLGYPEIRVVGGLTGPVIGNGAMTLSYVLTNNPLSAAFSHIAMHIAGVLRGPASVIQLPPHY